LTQISSLEDSQANAKEKIKSLEETLLTREEGLESIKQQLDSVNVEVMESKALAETSADELLKLKIELEEVRKVSATLAEEKNIISESLHVSKTNAEKENVSWKERLDLSNAGQKTLEKELRVANEKLSDLETLSRNAETEHNVALTALESSKSAVEEEILVLKENLEKMGQEEKSVREELSSTHTQLLEVREVAESSTKENVQLMRQLEELQANLSKSSEESLTQISSLEDSQANAKEKIKSLEETLLTREEGLESIKQQLDSVNVEVMESKALAETSADELLKLKIELEEVRKVSATLAEEKNIISESLHVSKTNAEKENVSWKERLDLSNAGQKTLEKELRVANEKLSDLETLSHNAESEKEKLAYQLKELNQKLVSLSEEHNVALTALESSKASADKEILSLKESLDTISKDKYDKEDELKSTHLKLLELRALSELSENERVKLSSKIDELQLTLDKLLEESQSKYSSLQHATEASEKIIKSLEEKLQTNKEGSERLEKELDGVNAELVELYTSLEATESENRQLKTDMEEIGEASMALSEEKKAVSDVLHTTKVKTEKEIYSLKERLHLQYLGKEKLEQELNTANAALSELRILSQTKETEKDALVHQFKELQKSSTTSSEESSNALAALQSSKVVAEEEIMALKESLEKIGIDKENIQDELRSTSVELQKIYSLSEISEKEKVQLRSQLDELKEALSKSLDEYKSLQSLKGVSEDEMNLLRESLLNSYADKENCQKQLSSCRSELCDLQAISEATENEKRNLMKQLDDVNQTVAVLSEKNSNAEENSLALEEKLKKCEVDKRIHEEELRQVRSELTETHSLMCKEMDDFNLSSENMLREKNELKEKFSILQKEKEGLKNKIVEIEQSLNEALKQEKMLAKLRTDSDAEAERLKSELEELRVSFACRPDDSHVALLQSKLNDALSQISLSDSKYREMLEFERHELIADAESAMDELRRKLEVANKQVSQAEKDRSIDTNDIVLLREEVHKLKGKLIDEEERSSTNDQKYKATQKKLEEKISWSLKLESQISDSQRNMKVLEDKIRTHDSLEKKYNLSTVSLKEEIADLQEQLHGLTTRESSGMVLVNTLREQVSVLSKDLENEKMSSRGQKERLDEVAELCKDYKEKLCHAGSELNNAKKSMKNLKDRLQSKTLSYDKLETKYTTSTLSLQQEMMELRELIQGFKTRESTNKNAMNQLKQKLSYKALVEKNSDTSQIEYENEINVLKAEIEKLRTQLTHQSKSEAGASSSQELADANQKLHVKCKNALDQIKVKDARIKKLEATKLTNEQVARLKQMKVERQEYLQRAEDSSHEVKKLKKIINELKLKQSSTPSDLNNSVKNALETKLRKYATYCQKLEKEKNQIVESIKSVVAEDISFCIEDDVPSAVSQLCEKLGATEDVDSALLSAEKQSHDHILNIDYLKTEIKSLQDKIQNLNDLTLRQKKDLDDSLLQLSKIKKENNALNGELKNMKNEVHTSQIDQSKQVRYLEKENLQLMSDLKKFKSLAQTAKSELDWIKSEQNSKVSSSDDLGCLPRSPLQTLPRKLDTSTNKENIIESPENHNPFVKKSMVEGSNASPTPSGNKDLSDTPGECSTS